ncbi:MAG: ribosome-binding factor ribosome-binding factor [Candidatus Parcubacteria bacterium]|jgi:ribosome-binding factor A
MNFRDKRVAGLIAHELGQLLVKQMEFDGVLVTITDVDVDAKLDNAVTRIAVLPEEKAAIVLKALNAAQPKLQSLLAKKIHIKPMPRVRFEYDSGAVNAAAVEKALLNQ